jgi:hypothetical protein
LHGSSDDEVNWVAAAEALAARRFGTSTYGHKNCVFRSK